MSQKNFKVGLQAILGRWTSKAYNFGRCCWPDANCFGGPIEHSSHDRRHFYGWLAVALFATGCIATRVLAQIAPPPAAEVTELELGKTVERQLAGGQSHEFRVTLQAGQYANFLLAPQTVRV